MTEKDQFMEFVCPHILVNASFHWAKEYMMKAHVNLAQIGLCLFPIISQDIQIISTWSGYGRTWVKSQGLENRQEDEQFKASQNYG